MRIRQGKGDTRIQIYPSYIIDAPRYMPKVALEPRKEEWSDVCLV